MDANASSVHKKGAVLIYLLSIHVSIPSMQAILSASIDCLLHLPQSYACHSMIDVVIVLLQPIGLDYPAAEVIALRCSWDRTIGAGREEATRVEGSGAYCARLCDARWHFVDSDSCASDR